MGRYRFVDPAEVRLELEDGDYLIVKEQLNAGETLDTFARMRAAEAAAGECPKCGEVLPDRVDPLQIGIAVILAYLLDWSLADKAGRLVSVRDQPPATVESALRALAYDEYQAILAAVQAHETRIQATRQEKKRPGGVTASDRIWPSPVAVAGGTNG